MTEPQVWFDVYGLWLGLGGDWPEVLESLRLDLAWFERPRPPHTPHVEAVIRRRAPDLDAFDGVPAAFVTPRNVVYQADGRKVIEYFGRAASVVDRAGDRVVVQGEDQHLVTEAAYHFLVSRVGRHLDARGLTRLHALGLAARDGGVAVLLPSGGGKSTLALRALSADGVRLLSEDAPLIDRRGRLHPFPLRIGVNPTDADLLPAQQLRRIERMEFHPKLALELSAFSDRIERRPQPLRHLVIGRRTLGHSARLEPVGGWHALLPLAREGVVGVGIYQGMEFVLQRGMRDVIGHAGIAATRALCCGAAAVRAQVWELTIGRDRERNWTALEPLLG